VSGSIFFANDALSRWNASAENNLSPKAPYSYDLQLFFSSKPSIEAIVNSSKEARRTGSETLIKNYIKYIP